MDTTHRRRVELGRMGLASDANAARTLEDQLRRGFAPDKAVEDAQIRRAMHRITARERIYHDALFGLLDDSEFLPLLRYAYDEAGLRHDEEPGDRNDWFNVSALIEDLISALDHALATDAARNEEIAA
jgi:hypothetical protein